MARAAIKGQSISQGSEGPLMEIKTDILEKKKAQSYMDWLREIAMLEANGMQKELYKKHKRVVDDVCEYLRIRSHVDGVRAYANKMPQYKWWKFKHFIAAMCLHEVHNFFGCIFDRDGLKGDSIFTDFFIAYTAKPKEHWQNNIHDLFFLTKYFREAYYQSGEENGFTDLFVNDPFGFHLHMLQEKRMQVEDGTVVGYFENLRDEVFQWRAKKIEEEMHPRIPKRTRRQYKRDNKRKMKRRKKFLRKVQQSEQAIRQNLKVFIYDDRFTVNCAGAAVYHHGHLNKPHIMIWDHKLRKEHIYLKVTTNNMDDNQSLFSGVEGINWELEHIAKNKTGLKPPKLPTLNSNSYGDYYEDPLEFEYDGGGFVDVGDYHTDWQRARLHYGEMVLSRNCVSSVGKGSAYLGGKILTQWMREKEFEVKQYELWEPDDYTNKEFKFKPPKEEEE
jgi:hypothetical protein